MSVRAVETRARKSAQAPQGGWRRRDSSLYSSSRNKLERKANAMSHELKRFATIENAERNLGQLLRDAGF